MERVVVVRSEAAAEIDLELAIGPIRPLDRPRASPSSLPSRASLHCPAEKYNSQLLLAAAQSQPAGLLPHLQRLHQLGHAHLFEPPLDHPGPRGTLLQLLQVQPVHNFFRHAHQVGHKKRLRQKILGRHQRAQLFLDISRGWPQK